jgi:hypothetical protein
VRQIVNKSVVYAARCAGKIVAHAILIELPTFVADDVLMEAISTSDSV